MTRPTSTGNRVGEAVPGGSAGGEVVVWLVQGGVGDYVMKEA